MVKTKCNKNCFKMNNSKTAESTGDLIDNTTADKITSVSKKSSKKITFKGVALRK